MAQTLSGSGSSGFPNGTLSGSGSSGATYGGSQTVQNPLGGINSFCGLIKAILTAVIQIGIPIAVLFIVYAGFKFVLARGNPAALQQAREGLMYTLTGLLPWLLPTLLIP